MKVVKKADDKDTVREALFPKRNAPGESDVGQACANKKRKQNERILVIIPKLYQHDQ